MVSANAVMIIPEEDVQAFIMQSFNYSRQKRKNK